MRTEIKFKNTLKALMQENTPLEKITVAMLTKRCKVTRQTFYYHFHDVYDLLTLVFLYEEIGDIKYANNLNSILKAVDSYYEKNKNFVDSVLKSEGKDLFHEFLYRNFNLAFIRVLQLNDKNHIMADGDIKRIAMFYASAFAYLITNFYERSANKTYKSLVQTLNFLDKDFLTNTIKKTAKAKHLDK